MNRAGSFLFSIYDSFRTMSRADDGCENVSHAKDVSLISHLHTSDSVAEKTGESQPLRRASEMPAGWRQATAFRRCSLQTSRRPSREGVVSGVESGMLALHAPTQAKMISQRVVCSPRILHFLAMSGKLAWRVQTQAPRMGSEAVL